MTKFGNMRVPLNVVVAVDPLANVLVYVPFRLGGLGVAARSPSRRTKNNRVTVINVVTFMTR
jgi:hypothetical protein